MSRPMTVPKPRPAQLRRVHTLAGEAAATPATASCRSVPAPRRGSARFHDRPVAPRPCQHRVRRFPRLHATQRVVPESAPHQRSPSTPGARANRHHLTSGPASSHDPGLALWPLDLGQVAGLPDPTTHRQAHQLRVPASRAENGGYCLRRVRRKLFTTDPSRRVILQCLPTWWHHRRRGAILADFDVQPITVKASGGRRRPTLHYRETLGAAAPSEDPGPVLLVPALRGESWPRPPGMRPWQRSQGCLSIPAARASMVSASAREDRLGSGPGASHQGQGHASVLRQLHLNRTSVPKRSPDDNPDETVFGAIQQPILDNSAVLDEGTTQRRISSHWQGRNRRSDRFIRIPSLEHPRRDSHKNEVTNSHWSSVTLQLQDAAVAGLPPLLDLLALLGTQRDGLHCSSPNHWTRPQHSPYLSSTKIIVGNSGTSRLYPMPYSRCREPE